MSSPPPSSAASSTTSTSTPDPNRKPTKPRKKKASRACIHCQKAHLTCDDGKNQGNPQDNGQLGWLRGTHAIFFVERPCQRCEKRGLASTCTDGARKKAKYLQDTDENSIRFSQPAAPHTIPAAAAAAAITAMPLHPFGVNEDGQLGNYDYGFGSSTTNLEYSILSNMLGSPINTLLDPTTPTSPLNTPPFTSSSSAGPSTPTTSSSLWKYTNEALQQQQSANVAAMAARSSSFATSDAADTPSSHPAHHAPQQLASSGLDTVLYSPDQPSMGSPPIFNHPATPPFGQPNGNYTRMSSLTAYGDGAVVAKVDSPNTVLAQVKRRNLLVTPDMVYNRQTKPFSYADGYHYLINYVRQKMSPEDLMRISRALALFRPSVLASMMNLTEDDLIFTEKCLQRTLLEYEKLISYSGTPTVVWRRTGEITLVGKEFSLLTQWSRDALLGKKTYIYELMSNPSAIEYWEKYSVHAFDNTDSAVYSSCILLSPTKRIVPCTFCFTIKRDIFDLPSVIVGNFLPILS
ncbi:hypothetical protein BC940DRAFT_275913 [Gongronella butleri]|nr:hypothetical protein BC940DRAFT_275913 [Gongronella butleri]